MSDSGLSKLTTACYNSSLYGGVLSPENTRITNGLHPGGIALPSHNTRLPGVLTRGPIHKDDHESKGGVPQMQGLRIAF